MSHSATSVGVKRYSPYYVNVLEKQRLLGRVVQHHSVHCLANSVLDLAHSGARRAAFILLAQNIGAWRKWRNKRGDYLSPLEAVFVHNRLI